MKKWLPYILLLLLNISGLHAQDKLTVFFDFNKYNLNDSATQQLQTWIADNPKIEVTKIYGFCDWKGTNHIMIRFR